MRLTQKIKSAINILKDVEKEGEKGEHNYIHFNRSKYFVFKNNLYKTQKYIKPAGTIKNGRIVLKGHKSIETLKHVQKGIRKIKSKKLNMNMSMKSPNKSFSIPETIPEKSDSVMPSLPFEKTEKSENSEKFEDFEPEPVSEPQFEKTEIIEDKEPVPEAVPEPEQVSEPEFEKTEIIKDNESDSEPDSEPLPEPVPESFESPSPPISNKNKNMNMNKNKNPNMNKMS